MIGKVKSIDLIDHDNWAYWPEDPLNFCVAVEAMIGPAEEDGAEIFSFEVCTPMWFTENRLKSATFIRHIVFVQEYDEDEIKHLIYRLVAETPGSSWTEIAVKLSRFMRWEFEDYS